MQFGAVMEVQHLHQELAASRARVQSLEEQLGDVKTAMKKAEKQLLTYDKIKEDSEPLQFFIFYSSRLSAIETSDIGARWTPLKQVITLS